MRLVHERRRSECSPGPLAAAPCGRKARADPRRHRSRPVDERGGFSSDPAWIYFDTDGDAKTGGFAVPGMLESFEYEARVDGNARVVDWARTYFSVSLFTGK